MRDLLTFDDAAEELQTTTFAVKRIVARGRIVAYRLRKSGPFRLQRKDLTAYVTAGAKDLDPPTLQSNWLDGSIGRSAVEFAEAISGAAEDQIPAQAPDSEPGAVRRVALKVSPAIRKVIERSVPVLFSMKGSPESPYRDWRELYLCHQIRNLARTVVDQSLTGLTPLDKLYADAAAYSRVTSEAAQVLSKRQISFTRQYLVQKGPVKVWESVYFELPHSVLLSGGTSIARVLEIAF